MPDRSLFTDHPRLRAWPQPTTDGSTSLEPGEVAVEVEVDGAWVRGLAHARRRVAGRTEVHVRSLNGCGDTGTLTPGWFGSDRIRAVHIGEPHGQPRSTLI